MQSKEFPPAQTDNDNKGFEIEADYDQYQPTPFSKRQKIAVAVLAIFGILVIVFWAVQFKTTLKNSLKYSSGTNTESSGTNEDVVANEDNKSNEILKTKDSDSDGLSDWDELNTYKTSPYLEDSDSDGYLDKKEIETDNDPNCPMGQVCVGTSDTSGDADSDSANTSDELLVSPITNVNSGSDVTTDSLKDTNLNVTNTQNGLSSGADAATLRKALEEAGFDKEMLNKISDKELLEAYQDTLSSQEIK